MNRHLLALGAEMVLPGGEAGASTPVLVKPADPTDVPLTAGTTTSSGSARTFDSPTGGSGSWTLAVTIDQAVGSGAVLAGDNSSGWYLTSLEDADAVKVIGTWTDDSTGQKVAASFLVVVGASGSASWATIETLAKADLANAGPYTTGTNSLDYDGTTIAMTATRNSSTGNVEAVANTGVVVTDVGGTMTAALLLDDVIPSWARAYSMYGPLAVHVPIDITFSATLDNGVVFGFNNTTTHNNGKFKGFRARWKDASNEQPQTRENSSDSNIGSTITPRTSRVLTGILHAGEIVEVMDTAGSTPPTPDPGGASTYMVGAEAVGQQDTAIVYDPLYLILNAVFNAVVTAGDIKIERWQ